MASWRSSSQPALWMASLLSAGPKYNHYNDLEVTILVFHGMCCFSNQYLLLRSEESLKELIDQCKTELGSQETFYLTSTYVLFILRAVEALNLETRMRHLGGSSSPMFGSPGSQVSSPTPNILKILFSSDILGPSSQEIPN